MLENYFITASFFISTAYRLTVVSTMLVMSQIILIRFKAHMVLVRNMNLFVLVKHWIENVQLQSKQLAAVSQILV